MEDTQNSGPDSTVTLETSKLGIGARRTDTQNVTKRYVLYPTRAKNPFSISAREGGRDDGEANHYCFLLLSFWR